MSEIQDPRELLLLQQKGVVNVRQAPAIRKSYQAVSIEDAIKTLDLQAKQYEERIKQLEATVGLIECHRRNSFTRSLSTSQPKYGCRLGCEFDTNNNEFCPKVTAVIDGKEMPRGTSPVVLDGLEVEG